MAARTSVTLEQARSFLADYVAAVPQRLSAVERGTVNSSYEIVLSPGRVFLRLYEEQDRAGAIAEAERLSYLASCGVVTPHPLRRLGGGFVGEMAGKPAVLFPWIDGDMRCLRSVTEEDGRRVGEALGRLHVAGVEAPRGPGRFEPADLRVRLRRIAAAPDARIACQAAPLVEKLRVWETRRDAALPRGLIHGDLFRDNVLWNEQNEICALLDFESASDGVLAYDLMVTVLAWSFKDTLDEAIARSIAVGYRSVRTVIDSELQGLAAEAAIAALRFTVTRLTDDALRSLETGAPPRADKDWRRFAQRLAWVESYGADGMRSLFAK
jgi:homoserine kinase type II